MYAQKAIVHNAHTLHTVRNVHNAHCAYRFKVQSCDCINFVRAIDPCMGSGHVLVYAFDVLLEIYRESGYSERDAASMIVKNNLFGLDIDDRASQLAYFAVMMKARSYDRRFLNRDVQANVFAIQESNLMEVDERRGDIGAYLMDTFRDAKELGSIITVEPKDYDGYIDYLSSCDGDGQLALTDNEWLLHTRPDLQALAEQAKVLSAKYNVVCTNPPYLNKMEGELKKRVTKEYKDYSGDLFSVFIYRNLMFCEPNGYCGYMTPFVWLFIKTYEKLRDFIIKNKSITTLVQMEYSAFEEATVPICSFVLKNDRADENGLYFKLSDFKGGMEVQKQKVLEALECVGCPYFFETDQNIFFDLPGKPISYWISNHFINLNNSNIKLSEIAKPRVGLQTSDNGRFTRIWFEISNIKLGLSVSNRQEAIQTHKKWFPFNKGGEFRKWYGNNVYVVNWENDGKEIRAYNDYLNSSRSSNIGIGNTEFYFAENATWTAISSGSLSVRYSPSGFINSNAGMAIFGTKSLFYVLALLNSVCTVDYFIRVYNQTLNFNVGDIERIPVIINHEEMVNDLTKNCISLSNIDWNAHETSWDFKRNPLI